MNAAVPRTRLPADDSISIEPSDAETEKVIFHPFVGVAPRRYIDFFTMKAKRKNSNGEIFELSLNSNQPNLKQLNLAHLSMEDAMINAMNFIQIGTLHE